MKQLNAFAADLDTAAHTATATTQLSDHNPVDLADAYAIQALSIDRRVDRGERIIGYKLGFTSKAKMEQMGVHDIIWGRLTDKMEIISGGVLRRDQFIHPRVEPEIAFRVSRRIEGAISLEEVFDYIDGVTCSLEVIDSRYENFKFSLEDVVADNCSSSAFVLGKWLPVETSVQNLAIAMNINGEEVQTGNSAAILGNPLDSLVQLSRMMERYDAAIEVGDVVLAGAATSAIALKLGDRVEGQFEELGTVNFTVA